MGELKPIGSEKLKGEEQIKRILDLTYYQSNGVRKESSEIVKEGKSGVYGIVKEKDGYYVKKGLNENSLDYIGGMFMKNKNKFSSYGEALKKLEFLTEQENLQEATRYVLKQPKPAQSEAPMAEPTTDVAPAAPAPMGDVAPAPEGDPLAGGEDLPTDGEDFEDPNDFMKVLQKLAGKLQQKINKYEDKLESKDYAAIINQVLSAVDFEKLDEEDKDEILSQFEDAEEIAEPTSDFPTDGNGEVPAPQETDEIDGMAIDGVASLDELINTPLDEFEDDDYFDDSFDDDLDDNGDDDFLNDPEIKKAARLAKKDISREYGDEDSINDPLDLEGGSDEMDELVAIDSDVNDVPGEASDDGEVRELDIEELTSMVNNSVKETLGKYFE